jgi:hypothetical protein
MTQLKELLKHISSKVRSVFLSGATIAVILVASTQGEVDYEKAGLRSHVAWNCTWVQQFIPINWLKFAASPPPAIRSKAPKRLKTK